MRVCGGCGAQVKEFSGLTPARLLRETEKAVLEHDVVARHDRLIEMRRALSHQEAVLFFLVFLVFFVPPLQGEPEEENEQELAREFACVFSPLSSQEVQSVEAQLSKCEEDLAKYQEDRRQYEKRRKVKAKFQLLQVRIKVLEAQEEHAHHKNFKVL